MTMSTASAADNWLLAKVVREQLARGAVKIQVEADFVTCTQ